LNRGLYRLLKGGGWREVAWRRTLFFPDLKVVAFEVDVQRLPVKIEQLLDPGVAHQMQASLNGRKVKVTNSQGLVFGVALEPDPPRPKVRLPKRVLLSLDTRPEGAYMIPVGVGKDGPVWCSLLGTGHILVGGESGSGKSTFLNAMLVGLLDSHTPGELQVVIVDPKQVEFQGYNGAPHLLGQVAVDVGAATTLLERQAQELERRRELFAQIGVKNLTAYNRQADEPLPLILLIVDEVTDISLKSGLKSAFYRNLIHLVSVGRAFGLVVVLATQNPKAEVLNTLIRGNMSTRIAFRVVTAEHSRVILGMGGAQELPRTIRGRMLARLDGEPVTLQGFYVSDEEIDQLTARLRSQPVRVLTDQERAMVMHAVENLEGKFTIRDLADAFDVTHHTVRKLAEGWERRGLLSPSENTAQGRTGRRVTERLLEMVLQEQKGVPQR